MARAYLWALLWHRMAEKAVAHCASLDPRTDRLAVVRWHGRWLRARARKAEALRRFHVASLRPQRLPN